MRRVRAGTELDWVIPHTFRKTVATRLDEAGLRRMVANQLGHSRVSMTQDTYFDRHRVPATSLPPPTCSSLRRRGDHGIRSGWSPATTPRPSLIPPPRARRSHAPVCPGSRRARDSHHHLAQFSITERDTQLL